MAKKKKHSGFTLVELCISLALMSLVMVAGMQLLGITFKGVHDIDDEIRVEREDSAFASLVNENIQKSTILFTVPKKSFINEKLTNGWNYIGVMDNVHIPKACSRTGKEIEKAKALVYIEYLGSSKPSAVGYDCNLIKNDQGYFSQKIIGHSFTDSNGNFHDYSIIFEPEDPTQENSQNITYKFTSTVTDKDGNKVGEGKGIDIDTMLHSLNSLNINYHGNSTDNPAVAIAFKPKFMPVQGTYQVKSSTVNVVLVLNMSDEMGYSAYRNDGSNTVTKADAAKEEVLNLLSQLSSNLNNVNVFFVPYSNWGGYGPLYGIDEDDIEGQMNIKYLYDLNTDYEELKNDINRIKVDGNNNGGDGIRTAYVQLQKAKNEGIDLSGNNYLIYVNGSNIDRFSVEPDYINGWGTSIWSYEWAWSKVYRGYDMIPPSTDYPQRSFAFEDFARRYVGYWADELVRDFNIKKSYFINLYVEKDFGAEGMYRDEDYKFLSNKFTEGFNVTDIEQFKEKFEYIGEDIIEMVDSAGGPLL